MTMKFRLGGQNAKDCDETDVCGVQEEKLGFHGQQTVFDGCELDLKHNDE